MMREEYNDGNLPTRRSSAGDGARAGVAGVAEDAGAAGAAGGSIILAGGGMSRIRLLSMDGSWGCSVMPV